MRRIVRVLAVVGAALLLAGCPAWPLPDQNPDRTSWNDAETTITPANVADLEPLWSEQVNSEPGQVSAPVVTDGGVHVTKGCSLVTFDPGTGTERWSVDGAPDPDTCSLAIWHTSEPYTVNTGDGPRVIASWGFRMPVSPGSIRWTWQWSRTIVDATTGQDRGSVPGELITAIRGNASLAFGASRDQWQTDYNSLFVGTVDGTARQFPISMTDERGAVTYGSERIVHSGRGILTTAPGTSPQGPGVRGYMPNESRPGCSVQAPSPVPVTFDVECPVWVNPLAGAPANVTVTAPVLGGISVFVVAGGTVYAIDSITGTTRWTAAVGAGGQPALADRTLFVPTDDGRILTFDPSGCGGAPTCAPTGEFATGTGGDVSDPAVAGGVLYVTEGGSIHAFDRAGCATPPCAPLWSAATGHGQLSSPVVSQGQLYVGTSDSLLAYGLP